MKRKYGKGRRAVSAGLSECASKGRVLRSLMFSFFITGLYFLLVYRSLSFIYDINDDVAMRNVAAGVITGTPDAHLIHVKYVLGLLISGLYRLWPGLDWYGLVMIGIILFSFSLLLYRGLVAKKPLAWKLAYMVMALLLFTCLGLQHIAAFQWTVTAAVAGASGIYLFYTSQTKERFQMVLEEGLSVFLILLSLAVRDDVFLMVLPVAALAFCWKYVSFRKNGKWKIILTHLGVPAALAAGVLLIMGVEAFAYRSLEWKEFLSYNADREAIMDYYGLVSYEEDPEIYDSLGITQEEAENLQRYSLYLAEELYPEKMAALAEHAREVYVGQHPFRNRVKTALLDTWEHFGKNDYYPANLFCFVMIVLTLAACVRKNRRQLGLACMFLVLWAAYWFYLGFRARMILRVGFVLYLLGFLTLLGVWYRVTFLESAAKRTAQNQEAGQSGQPRVFHGLALTFVCAALAFTACQTWKKVEANNAWRWSYNLEFLDVNRYMAEHMENVYFMTTFSIETYTDNFTLLRDFAFTNLLSVGGWHTFSPLENEKAAKLGITDARRDMIEQENVYVISLENINLRYMDRYYASLYGEDYLGRKLTDRLDYGERIFEVYKFLAAVQP